MPGRLEGKVAFITGTGGGQGRAAALLFAREGAKVVGSDLKKEGGEETARMIQEAGGQSIFRVVDLANAEQDKDWLEWGVQQFGGIDVLYNNASATRWGRIGEMPWEDWEFTIRNELHIIYLVTHYAWPHLKARGKSSIINTGSTAGMVATPQIGFQAHAATKGGVIAITRQMAAEGAPFGIRANSISPGLIETPATQELLSNREFREGFTHIVPMGRLGKPEDIAPVALFLASDESGYVTGVNIAVDGGLTAI